MGSIPVQAFLCGICMFSWVSFLQVLQRPSEVRLDDTFTLFRGVSVFVLLCQSCDIVAACELTEL